MQADNIGAIYSLSGCAVYPSSRCCICYYPIIPLRAADDIIAVEKGCDAARAHIVIGCGADETVGYRYRSGDAGAAIPPRHCSRIRGCSIIPVIAADNVIAVAQGCDAAYAHIVIGCGADETVGYRYRSGDAGAAIPPRHCSRIRGCSIIPVIAADDVIAVEKGGDAAIAHIITGCGADETVCCRDGSGDAGAAIPPRHCSRIRGCSIIPVIAADDVIAVEKGGDAAIAHIITGCGADETVCCRDGSGDAGAAIPPRHCSRICGCPIIPVWAADDVIAVEKGGDAAFTKLKAARAHIVTDSRADETVCLRDGSGDAGAAIPPRHGSCTIGCPIIPCIAADDVIAVTQGCDAAHAHIVIGCGADETVCYRDGSGDVGAAIPPRHRSRIRDCPIIPVRAADDVIAVTQGCDAVIAHIVIGCGADETVGCRDGSGDASGAIPPRYCSGLSGCPIIPVRAADDVIAIGKGCDAVIAHIVIGCGADETVCYRDGSGDAGAAIPPRHRSHCRDCPIIPVRAADNVIAVAQSCDAARAHIVIGCGACQGADERPRRAVEQINRSRVCLGKVIIGVGDGDVSRAQGHDTRAKPGAVRVGIG